MGPLLRNDWYSGLAIVFNLRSVIAVALIASVKKSSDRRIENEESKEEFVLFLLEESDSQNVRMSIVPHSV